MTQMLPKKISLNCLQKIADLVPLLLIIFLHFHFPHYHLIYYSPLFCREEFGLKHAIYCMLNICYYMCRLTVNLNKENESITLQLSDEPHMQMIITCQPFKVDIYDSGEPVISLNSKQLLNIEHLREKSVPKP